MTAFDRLARALAGYEISILYREGNKVFVEHDYCIEIEGEQLFKLSHEGFVIAPFDDLDALARMIKMG